MSNRKIKKRCIALLCIFITLILIIVGCYFINNVNKESKDLLVTINKEELQDMLDNNSTCWVYVGRESCPDCQEFYPELVEFLQEQQLHIYYYNTECRASEKLKVRAYYNSLGVQSVPTILEISNGIIEGIYDVQNKEDIEKFKRNILN